MDMMRPPAAAERGAGDAVASATPPRRKKWAEALIWSSSIATVGVAAAFGVWDASTGVWFADLLVWAAMGAAFVALVDGVVTAIKWLLVGLVALMPGRSSDRLRRAGTAPVACPIAALWFAFGWRLVPDDSPLGFARSSAVGSIVIVAIMASGVLWALARPDAGRWRRVVIPLLIPILTMAWLWWPGSGPDEALPDTRVTALLEDPGMPGPWTVLTTAYGSGHDRHRNEYGAGADVLTAAVDGSTLWAAPSGPAGAWWRWYWGFDTSSLPLNALVWYPDGPGRFPLALIVHGNHTATRPSDPGYAYLGEHLASRGVIAVSVDENFLNGSAIHEPGGAEMAARAWLLTEHLAQWHRWNVDPASEFFGMVDMDRVILIGHSRGGEAVVHAAGMLESACPPAAGHMAPDLNGVVVAGVVTIAPSDGQYRPCGRLAELRGVDFLTISGSSDADTQQFFGLAQFERTHPEGDGFAAAAYLERATHGRFNTEWGLGDLGGLDAPLLDRAYFLSEDEQQHATRTLIGAFVEASAHDRDEYRTVFDTPDATGWLASLVTTTYRTAPFFPLDPKDQDVSGFDEAAPEVVSLPDGYPTGDWVRHLQWSASPKPPSLSHRFAPRPLPDAVLVDMALTADTAQPDVTLLLETTDGAVGRAPLTAVTGLREPMPRHFVKSTTVARLAGLDIDLSETPELVFQTHVVPIDAFQWTEPLSREATITRLRISFDGSRPGDVYIDDIGLSDVEGR